MKKNILNIALFVLPMIGFAQINVQTDLQNNITGSSPFLDASGYTKDNDDDNYSLGKGLYFPQTDLTRWIFDPSQISRSSFITAFDGMVVYNTGSGNVGEHVSTGYNAETQGLQVAVEPGFYYFLNPDGKDTKSVSAGKWVRIKDASELANGTTSGDFWSLDGNAGTTEATIADDTHAISGGNFIGTTDKKSLTIATNNIARLTIGKEGGLINESVGGTPFDFVLKVYGKAKFDGGIVTKSSTYPDYVFDNYFTGASDVNPNYEFKKLNEVEKFIKENNHLPGVTKIDDLTKTENGYEVDNTQLSVQTLEKVEELYLHVIEQQKEIEALKAEIAELKK